MNAAPRLSRAGLLLLAALLCSPVACARQRTAEAEREHAVAREREVRAHAEHAREQAERAREQAERAHARRAPTGQPAEHAEIREQLAYLAGQAEDLEDAGMHKEADRVRRKIEEVEQRLAEERGEGRPGQEGRPNLERVLHGLEMGMESLAAINRQEELRMLERVADAVRREMGQGRHAPRADDERAHAERHLRLMRAAAQTLAEADRHDAAGLMTHAAMALAMDLEGRRDPEAREIRESAPGPADRIELIAMAAEIAADRGNAERAHGLAQFAGELREHHAARERRQERPAGERPRGAREREGPQQGERALLERIERLEQQVQRLGAALERVMQQRERPN